MMDDWDTFYTVIETLMGKISGQTMKYHRSKKCCGRLIRYCGLGFFLCDSCSTIYKTRNKK